MRVVAGTAKGRRLTVPPGDRTRPTSDRVREAVFNSLGSLLGLDGLVGARVLDLFAGSGALGIEALSREAAHATFVDSDRRAVAAIRANLTATGFADRATVVTGDAVRHLSAARPDAALYDVAFADPPYAFEGWPALLAALPAVVAVLESDRAVEIGPGWELVRVRGHGGSVVTIAQRRERST